MTGAIAEINLIIRLSLGFIFLGSALTKLRHPAAFVQAVLGYRILPSTAARAFGWLLPLAELGTAVLLLIGSLQLVAAVLTLLLLLSFAIALSINIVRGRAVPCHCFGAASTSRIGWHSLVRDVLLFPFAAWLLWFAVNDYVTLSPSVSLFAPIVCIASLAALSYVLMVEMLDLAIGSGRWRHDEGVDKTSMI